MPIHSSMKKSRKSSIIEAYFERYSWETCESRFSALVFFTFVFLFIKYDKNNRNNKRSNLIEEIIDIWRKKIKEISHESQIVKRNFRLILRIVLLCFIVTILFQLLRVITMKIEKLAYPQKYISLRFLFTRWLKFQSSMSIVVMT